jgi:leader peptidase (prepilin peptidase) / N-methyltransferase
MALDVGLAIFLFALLGLFIGSFLNVVIHRLPLMMDRAWQHEIAQYQAEQQRAGSGLELAAPEKFNLMVPRSRCPHCGHKITALENIPVLSYLFLGGKCSQCKAKISLRYPLVEIVTAALFGFCAWRFGASWTALAWSGFCAALVSLALIDWDTTLLPDDITLPLLWAGLILAALGMNPLTNLTSALWGAVAGYLCLWSIYWLFKLATGKEGMGYGDFKLLGALGAWLGWQALIPIILLSSVIGAIVGIAMKMNSALREGGYVPFGPFLAGAGLACLMIGSGRVLRFVGL